MQKTFESYEDAEFYLENLEMQGKLGHTIEKTSEARYKIVPMDAYAHSTIRNRPENYACVKFVDVPNSYGFDIYN